MHASLLIFGTGPSRASLENHRRGISLARKRLPEPKRKRGRRQKQMQKELIAVFASAVVALVAAGCSDQEKPPHERITNAPPIAVTNELPPVEPGASNTIPDGPQKFTSVFEAKGRGTYAAWGAAVDADIYYLLKLDATSTVESKEEPVPGKIRVEEIRTFHEATEIVKPTKVNPRIDLSTVPVDQIEATGHLLAAVVSLLGAPSTGLEIEAGVIALRVEVDEWDGLECKQAVDLLGQFGIDVQKIIDEPVEQFLAGLLDEVHSHVNAVQGKSYRFVYWTDKEGEPLRVRYENVDHSPISQEEQNILNYVNLFLDCHFLPDKNCRPGDQWIVGAPAIASMFGIAADGTCAGDVQVTRGNDRPDGNWNLVISPATITLYSADNRPIGNLKLHGGKAVGDGRRAVLRELQIDGTGKWRQRDTDTKLWLYDFITKIEGDCEFRSTLLPREQD